MKKQQVDYKKIGILFFNACSFKEVSFLILNNLDGYGISTDCNVFSAVIVNGMLATEVFLKFIYAYDYSIANNTSKTEIHITHDIYYLYSLLSSKRKTEICNELNQYKCDSATLSGFLKIFDQNSTERDNNVLDGDIVNWRYLVANGKNEYRFDLNIMVKLIEALYSISRSIINLQSFEMDLPSMSSSILDDCSEIIVDSLYITPYRPEWKIKEQENL